jgi:hypothetical protein
LELYKRRRELILKTLDDEIAALTKRRAFVAAVVGGKIQILSRARKDVEAAVAALGFEGGGVDALLAMPLSALTKEKITELDKAVEARKKKRGEMAAQSAEGLWLLELDLLDEGVRRYYAAFQDDGDSGPERGGEGMEAVAERSAARKRKPKRSGAE